MDFRVFIAEEHEERTGGGSFGCNQFIRTEYPEGTKELDSWICTLCEISDKVDTSICTFYVVNDKSGKVVARGTIKNCKTVNWKDV